MSLARNPISDAEYKADLDVLDRYQAYSTEVARVATLMIIAFGFLLSFAFHEGTRTQFGNNLFAYKWLLMIGIGTLGSAVGFALGHRYVSTDALSSLIRTLRLAKASANDEESAREQEKFVNSLKRSSWLIAAASLCLVIGTACIALAALAALAA